MLGLGNNISVGSAPSEWTPEEISSLIHWYRYDTGLDKSTIDDVENVVTQWADQKGSNNLVGFDADGGGSVDADEAPVWIDGGGLFIEGGSDSMSLNSELQLGKFAIYARHKWASGSTLNSETLFEKTSGSNDWIKIQSSTAGRIKVDGNRHDYSLPATISLNTLFNYGFERSADGTMQVYLDGSAGTQSGTGDGNQPITDLLDIGRIGQPMGNSYIYEIVICSDALSADDRRDLNTYFNNISGT